MMLGDRASTLGAALPLGVTLLALGVSATMVQAQTGFEFMPDGGRNLAVQVFPSKPAALAEMMTRELDAEQWKAVIQGQNGELTEAEILTLAGYLALNLPLDESAVLADLPPENLAVALPRDGKDLAIRNCQGCHGFYTGYLGHDRDVNGWLVMFNSPFHLEIRMTPVERRTFAHYSAVNLPMPIENVPVDLRH